MNGKQYTLEERRIAFDLVLEKMTEGKGLSMTKACRSVNVCPSTFLLWIEKNLIQDETANERYMRASKLSTLLEADDIVDDISSKFDKPMTNEYGIDKGFVEMEKVRASIRQWRLNGRTRMFIDKQEDQGATSKDIGAITVNFIRDTDGT